MRINVRHLNLRTGAPLDRWVEDQLLALGEARRIDEANVRLECLANSSPRFAVRIHLVTPGPDVFAECRDHTLRAAFTKAIRQLREAVTRRATRRLAHLRLLASAAGIRGSRALRA